MSVINATPLLAAAGGDYQISRSVRLRSSASAYFNRTPASAGNRKTWTWNGWVKRGAFNSTFQGLFGDGTSNNSDGYDIFFFENDNTLRYLSSPNNAVNDALLISTQVFRDPSAWAMVTLSVDTTQATASNRVKIYYNGTQITSFSTATYPTQNTDLQINRTIEHKIGKDGRNSNGFYLDGYLTEVNFIDGQALTPSSFGETDAITGVWKPKKYAGTYGTNGFYLNFSDNSSNTATTIGKDNSGNGNNWTPNNISVTAGVTYDSMIDVPTLYADGGNGRGNYATLNPLSWRFAVAQGTFSEGNLRFTYSGGSSAFAFGTIGVSSGKWYCETTITAVGGAGASVGISDLQAQWGTFTNRFVYNSDGTHTGAGANWATYTTNDVIGIAYDLDANSLSFYKNNALQGSVTLNSGVTYHLELDAVLNSIYSANFGQRPFAYTPPTGFKALNTQNLPEPVIKKGNQWFDAKLWSGTGSPRSITGYAFAPDFVWIKGRSVATNHLLSNTVTGPTKILHTNSTSAENTRTDQITSFNSDGFSLGTDSSDGWSNYVDGRTYVGWGWKESVSAGFDIVTYTGNGSTQNVSHGLGVKPAIIILKDRDTSGARWPVYHSALGASFYMYLEGTDARSNANIALTWGNNTTSVEPTSTVFTIGSAGNWNANTKRYVAYCFSEVAGFSKFGSYTGNGSTDGPFVFCGFRPRFVMIKCSSAVEQWAIKDTARNPNNTNNAQLFANASSAEDVNNTYHMIDFNSNGFKIRGAAQDLVNGSGQTYIFMAFAESPFKHSLAR